MVVKTLLAVTFLVFTSMTAVSAQTAAVPATAPPALAFGPDPIIQITTTFRARIDGATDPREVPTTTAQDTARRLLYNMAANECAVLAEYWKAACRLSSLAVYSSFDSGLDLPKVPSMVGTAVYELRLTSLQR
jgi:hypothetical protein